MLRKSKIKIDWSPHLAYSIGLLTSDGNLSKDGRHIDFTSKDMELITIFRKCLALKNKIGLKTRGDWSDRRYFRLQFGDKNFYQFLLNIGLSTAKSRTLGTLTIPPDFFADFLRGCIDGDGSISTSKHRESRKLQLKTRLFSGSLQFLNWIRTCIMERGICVGGGVWRHGNISVLQYGKLDSISLFNYIYYAPGVPKLMRKYLVAKQFMRVW